MKTVPMTELCAPTQIPSDIQDRIYRHFKHRRLCSEDDEFFVDEFQDKLLTVEHQFLELLRNELVEYDPMVAEYIVQLRQIIFVQSLRELLPAQCNGVAGDKGKLPTVFLKNSGGAALPPTGKGLQALEQQTV